VRRVRLSGLQIARPSFRIPILVPLYSLSNERLGTSTRNDLHVLCYQHHTQMLLRVLDEPAESPLYACKEPGCLIRYAGPRGYFLDTEDAGTIEMELIPRVNCSNDGYRMYLAEVLPEKRNYRLWQCPECNQACVNDEETSGGLGKKIGA
jgi:hypothetical protein